MDINLLIYRDPAMAVCKFNIHIGSIYKLYMHDHKMWHNCSFSNSCSLKTHKLEAARIVTGLLISTSTEYLYSATGWGKVKGESSNLKHPIST